VVKLDVIHCWEAKRQHEDLDLGNGREMSDFDLLLYLLGREGEQCCRRRVG